MTRREMIEQLVGGLVGGLVGQKPEMAAVSSADLRLACSLAAFRIQAGDLESFRTLLQLLQDLQFDGFEAPANWIRGFYYARPDTRAIVEEVGMTFFGVHLAMEMYDPTTQIPPFVEIRKLVDRVAEMKAERLIVSGAGLMRLQTLSREALRRKVDGLNEAGEYCRVLGMRLAYHNHGLEMEADAREMRELIWQTDPDLVDFVVDVERAHRTGLETATFLRDFSSRIVGLHVRDFKGDLQVPLGQGELPLDPLVAAIRALQWKGWVVSREERVYGLQPGQQAVAPARQTLRRLFGR